MDYIYFKSEDRIDGYQIDFNDETLDLNALKQVLELENISNIQPDYEYIKVGPIINKTAFSTNVVNILEKIGITNINSFNHIKLYDVNTSFTLDPMLEKVYSEKDKTQLNNVVYPSEIDLDNEKLSKYGLFFDDYEFQLYQELFLKLDRQPTFIELYDLCQSNSEHSRHWFFKGRLYRNNEALSKTLFQLVKSTLRIDSNSLISFSDNSSVIQGFDVDNLQINDNKYRLSKETMDIVLTAETHNFPTLISPFEGANTGVGGRVRDNHATGKGAYLIGSLAGYCVGDVDFSLDYNSLKYGYKNPLNILIEASNGASNYGNKLGEPIIGGFTRSFKNEIQGSHIEWTKPIMYSAGVGYINRIHINKDLPSVGQLVIRLGGPAYRIGLGGGFSSSVSQNSQKKNLDYMAVQRGDPLMANKLNRVIKTCIDLGYKNPIKSIHDQGAGGLANVVKEIVHPYGAIINLDRVTLGDNSLQPLEIWCSEFQESDVILVQQEDLQLLKAICEKENICCDTLGIINNSNTIKVTHNNKTIVDLPLKDVLEPDIQKSYNLDTNHKVELDKFSLKSHSHSHSQDNCTFESIYLVECLKKVLGCLDVSSKRYLVNKVDRSVTGKIITQQCIGPFQTPISNYSLVSIDYFSNTGIATSIGERPYLGFVSPRAQGSISVCEMITNMMGVYIQDIKYIKCSANWMWSIKSDKDKDRLYNVAEEMCYAMKELEIGIDGGKDSLSMMVKHDNKEIKGPGNLVIAGYAPCFDINKKVTPDFKMVGSYLVHISFSNERRIGGSTFSRECCESMLYDVPEVTDYRGLKNTFNIIQAFLYNNNILSLHDISDGGLITTICEMCISSNIGVRMEINDSETFSLSENMLIDLFSEECGVVLEIGSLEIVERLCSALNSINVNSSIIGQTIAEKNLLFASLNLSIPIKDLLEYWETPSLKLDMYQNNLDCSLSEYRQLMEFNIPEYFIPQKVFEYCVKPILESESKTDSDSDCKLNVGIIRDEGSNGSDEMAAVFKKVGFTTYDLNMNTLVKTPELVRDMIGLVYVGGFSNGDVLESSHGWYLTIKHNRGLKDELDKFMLRPDTFSLGVCNGCQLMVKNKVFSDTLKLTKNVSNKFESRYLTVTINNEDNIFFKDMYDMKFGIWVAHGEGRFINIDKLNPSQKVLVYSNPTDENNKLVEYPYNPNGSEEALAGVVSLDGRHLAMMPHLERSFRTEQLPYLGEYVDIEQSPWLYVFRNLYNWCVENKNKIDLL